MAPMPADAAPKVASGRAADGYPDGSSGRARDGTAFVSSVAR